MNSRRTPVSARRRLLSLPNNGFLFALMGMTILIIQRPLFDQNLWWNLARGREVIAGTWAPSLKLLVLETHCDTEWLGSGLLYLAYALGGQFAICLLPVLMAFTLLAYTLRQASLPLKNWETWIWLAAGLLVLRPGLQPVPELFDLVGLLALQQFLRERRNSTALLLKIFIVFALWGNLGPRPIWGFFTLSIFLADQGPNTLRKESEQRFQNLTIGAALLGGMCTPGGWRTWRDSILQFAPTHFVSAGFPLPENWQPAFATGFNQLSTIAFLILWSWGFIARVLGKRASDPRTGDHPSTATPPMSSEDRVLAIGLWTLPCAAVALSRHNLSPAGLWILLNWGVWKLSADGLMKWSNGPLVRQVVKWGIGSLLGAVALLDLFGLLSSSYGRLGWGFSHELSLPLLDDEVIASCEDPAATGWSDDSRSVGIVCWMFGPVRMLDHPQRALLGNRTEIHALFRQDLLGSHRAGYRRDDGSWGGWVGQAIHWKLSAIFVPVDDFPLNQALRNTPWKPVDLDAPTIPYLNAEDTQNSKLILRGLQQQVFVETGPWRPGLEIYDGFGWRSDWLEGRGLGSDPAPAIHQSKLFRSLDLPLGATRALLPLRTISSSRDLRDEFAACQADLLYQEWWSCGTVSDFRRLVAEQMGSPDLPRLAKLPVMTAPSHEDQLSWQLGLQGYLEGQLSSAADHLAKGSLQQQYAAAIMFLEAGNLEESQRLLDSLSAKPLPPSLQILVEYWQQELRPH